MDAFAILELGSLDNTFGNPPRTKLKDDHWCYLCNGPAETTDHIEPKMRQGRLTGRWNQRDNLARACYNCNHCKGGSILIVFLAKRRLRLWPYEQKRERVLAMKAELRALGEERLVRNAAAIAKIAARRAKRAQQKST